MGRVLLALALAVQVSAVPMTVLAQDPMSRVDQARTAVARSAAEWESLWRDHAGQAPRPPVDFSTSMVAAVFLGSRPTGGISAEIVGTRRADDAVVIEWTEKRPGPGQVAPPVLTSPAVLVQMPRVEGAIRFEKVSK
ncbi:MAG: protease complex subunit PrcB family protein [Vicinamibacterales bacterium]